MDHPELQGRRCGHRDCAARQERQAGRQHHPGSVCRRSRIECGRRRKRSNTRTRATVANHQPRPEGVVMKNSFMALMCGMCAAGAIAVVFVMPRVAFGQGEVRQPGAVYDFDFKDEKPVPAPRRDISGIWEPAAGPGAGINATGAQQMPSDGKPEHELPYTPEGRAAFLSHKPTFGVTMVPSALTNDPMPGCDPQGFPRIVLHNFRTSRIIQTPENVVILYEFNKKWRTIWTDGRQLPKEAKDVAEPRWWGYSVGRWVDDDTFAADSIGFDDRTWLDNAGRPHSDEMKVHEEYKRTDRDHLQMTIVIDDPKFYTKPWTALILSLRLQSPKFDIREME